jgi:hypothetical protein
MRLLAEKTKAKTDHFLRMERGTRRLYDQYIPGSSRDR